MLSVPGLWENDMHAGPEMHERLMELARRVALDHEVDDEEDGQRYFNLYTFIQALEIRLETALGGIKFDLGAHDVARYLWCCMTNEPAGDKYRGMPILD